MMKDSNNPFFKFLLLWSGEFISAIGNGLTSFGLGVYIFQQTGSASAMALVTLLAFMPSLLLSSIAGVLADRYDRRLLMILGDGFSALGLVFILICIMDQRAQLWQICTGVTISSVFSSLLEPAYKATVTDLLTEEQYTKASGLVGIAGSAKYLISPVIAGFLLSIADIRLLLILDIGTFFITAAATLVVRKGLISKNSLPAQSFIQEFLDGWNAISKNKGVLILIIMTSVITFFLGIMQTLCAPMLLSFTSSSMLGIGETICASGMLVSSVIIGSISIKKGYVKMLCVSMLLAGFFMAMFGMGQNIILICFSGFLFFSMLPFANASLDYLTRTNIKNELQGRAWGLIGLISQLGYVFAYAVSGVAADTIGNVLKIGTGKGAGIMIVVSGILLSVTSIILYHIKSVKPLENGGAPCTIK